MTRIGQGQDGKRELFFNTSPVQSEVSLVSEQLFALRFIDTGQRRHCAHQLKVK